MTTINNYETSWQEAFNSVTDNIANQSSALSTGAQKISTSLSEAEQNYIKALSDGDTSNDAAAQIAYQRAERAMQAFTELLQNMHRTMMDLIRKLGQ